MIRPCASRRLPKLVASAACIALASLLLPGARAQQLTVSAAASLTNAFGDIGRAFEAAVPGVSVRFNLGASGVLLQQLAQGAPVDVFASADQETMDRAAQRSLIDEASRVDFATNVVVLVEPRQAAPGSARCRTSPDRRCGGSRSASRRPCPPAAMPGNCSNARRCGRRSSRS